MGADMRHVAAGASLWKVETAQLLEEHHLVAWSHVPAHRRRFGQELAAYLGGMDDTQVCELPGAGIRDIFSFCNHFERSIRNDRVRRSIDAKGGIVDTLRLASDHPQTFKRRFFIWHDADILLRYDHKLFGRLADAVMGSAAEWEYANEDLLLIQRVVFVGAPSLDVYAEDPRGQFRRWYAEDKEEPLWATVTGIESPPVLRQRIDPGFDDPHPPTIAAPSVVRATGLPSARSRARRGER